MNYNLQNSDQIEMSSGQVVGVPNASPPVEGSSSQLSNEVLQVCLKDIWKEMIDTPVEDSEIIPDQDLNSLPPPHQQLEHLLSLESPWKLYAGPNRQSSTPNSAQTAAATAELPKSNAPPSLFQSIIQSVEDKGRAAAAPATRTVARGRMKRTSKDILILDPPSPPPPSAVTFAGDNTSESGARKRRQFPDADERNAPRLYDMIDENLLALRRVVPFSSTSDVATMLCTTVEYIKSMQAELQELDQESEQLNQELELIKVMNPQSVQLLMQRNMMGTQTTNQIQPWNRPAGLELHNSFAAPRLTVLPQVQYPNVQSSVQMSNLNLDPQSIGFLPQRLPKDQAIQFVQNQLAREPAGSIQGNTSGPRC